MAEMPFEEFYLPQPDEPAGVLMWGKSPEQIESDRTACVARIGGFRAPDYGQAYLLSANTLLRAAHETNTLDHHSLPIFFLQRHAAELMLKSPLRIGVDIENIRKKIGKKCNDFPNTAEERNLERHGLAELLSGLKRMSEMLDLGPVPEVLDMAIKSILEVEQQHTWSRYSFHREKVDQS